MNKWKKPYEIGLMCVSVYELKLNFVYCWAANDFYYVYTGGRLSIFETATYETVWKYIVFSMKTANYNKYARPEVSPFDFNTSFFYSKIETPEAQMRFSKQQYAAAHLWAFPNGVFAYVFQWFSFAMLLQTSLSLLLFWVNVVFFFTYNTLTIFSRWSFSLSFFL